jgi:CubicO group peptidase (beta-lactamase class C family)
MTAGKSAGRTQAGLPTAEPEETGFSSGRLARIAASMERLIDSRAIPGAITVVARHGRIVHFQCQGLMDIEANKPMAGDTIFRLASMTKPIACVGLMTLYEEGRFLLDQPISLYLPSFKHMRVRGKSGFTDPARREITFRDCLTMTAGFSLQEWGKINSRFPSGPPKQPLIPGTRETINQAGQQGTLEESVELLSKVPLNFHPGTDWEYHTGHEVVGVLIEKISGQSLDKYLQERIFGPLKMVDTHFYLPAEKVGRFAAAYTLNENSWGHIGLVDSPATSAKVLGPKTFFSAGGGLLSTAADYARFAQMMLNGGSLDGVNVLSRKTIELMTTNHTGDFYLYPMGAGWGYGLGVTVRVSLEAAQLPGSLGTYGWGGAYATTFFIDPKEDLFGLLLTQVSDNQHIFVPEEHFEAVRRRDFQRLVYQALE